MLGKICAVNQKFALFSLGSAPWSLTSESDLEVDLTISEINSGQMSVWRDFLDVFGEYILLLKSNEAMDNVRYLFECTLHSFPGRYRCVRSSDSHTSPQRSFSKT